MPARKQPAPSGRTPAGRSDTSARTPAGRPARPAVAGLRESRRLEKLEMSRRYILDAAERLFSEEGYAGTSLERIAADSEFSIGGVYQLFASKQDILQAVFDRRSDDLKAALAPVLDEDLPADAKLAKLIATRREFSATWPQYGRLLERMYAVGSERLPVPLDLPRRMAEWLATIGDVITSGQSEGLFCDGPPQQLAHLVSSLMYAYNQMAEKPTDDALSMEAFTALVLRALAR